MEVASWRRNPNDHAGARSLLWSTRPAGGTRRCGCAEGSTSRTGPVPKRDGPTLGAGGPTRRGAGRSPAATRYPAGGPARHAPLVGGTGSPRLSRSSFTSTPFSDGQVVGGNPIVALYLDRDTRSIHGQEDSLVSRPSPGPRARLFGRAQYVGLDQVIPVAGAAHFDHIH